MSNVDERGEVARFYTRSRRFPKVIGRLHDGTRIPGGPYTITQAVVGGIAVMVALTTRAQWGTGTIIIDLPLCVLLAWGAAWGAGRIPSTRRNIVSVIVGGATAVLRPFEGRYKDQTFRLRPPHYAGGKAAISATHQPSPAPTVVPAPVPAPQRATPVPARSSASITGVERLLEQARNK